MRLRLRKRTGKRTERHPLWVTVDELATKYPVRGSISPQDTREGAAGGETTTQILGPQEWLFSDAEPGILALCYDDMAAKMSEASNNLEGVNVKEDDKPQPGDKVRVIMEGIIANNGHFVDSINRESYILANKVVEILERALPPEPPVGSYGHYEDGPPGNRSTYIRTTKGWCYVGGEEDNLRQWDELNARFYNRFVVDYAAPERQHCPCHYCKY